MTRLVTVAHGTRQVAGNEVARLITSAAGSLLGVPSVCSYVELCSPSFVDVLATSSEPTVVVPLLLSTGHHLRHDLPSSIDRSSWAVALGSSLGPDRLLAAVQVFRLLEAGATRGQPLVMVAVGSRDPLATRDLTHAVEHLVAVWGGEVRLATIAGLGPRPGEVVEPGMAVSSYLLSGGHFADRARSESLAAGASVVADVLGRHPLVVDLVVRRAAETRLSA